YEKAISHFKKILSNPIFYLFTDNSDYALDLLSKTNINFNNISNTNYHEINDVAELLIMSKCKHHIIANSTFSWWGAWLANSRNQKVIYPLPNKVNNWCWNYTGQIPKHWEPIRNFED
ncbi:alpha-1,2-fucosyltransferase, partial [Gammaproteobacteria bacterium]|nr:alpha-1,2-fucosyltransferase [Gammaproteobacteria bacterium]